MQQLNSVLKLELQLAADVTAPCRFMHVPGMLGTGQLTKSICVSLQSTDNAEITEVHQLRASQHEQPAASSCRGVLA
jgi:hypothetical protein